MAQAKRYCGVSDSTLMRLINANILPAEQAAPFAPYGIKQSDLDYEPVSSILKTFKKTGKLLLKEGTPGDQSEFILIQRDNNQGYLAYVFIIVVPLRQFPDAMHALR
jgi:hypothetical protein